MLFILILVLPLLIELGLLWWLIYFLWQRNNEQTEKFIYSLLITLIGIALIIFFIQPLRIILLPPIIIFSELAGYPIRW